jgi:hypothetical protein
MRKLATLLATILLIGAGWPSHAEPDSRSAEEAIRAIAQTLDAPMTDEDSRRFCSAWSQLKLGMPFVEVEALGIDMNGACRPGKPQSFHQPYMDLYFDAECRALHGATTLDC